MNICDSCYLKIISYVYQTYAVNLAHEPTFKKLFKFTSVKTNLRQ